MKTLSVLVVFLLLAEFETVLGRESIYYLYLNGSNALKLDNKVVQNVFSKTNSDFSIDFIVFIESGQLPGAIVFELKDICVEKSLLRLSIDSDDSEDEKDPRLTLSVSDERKVVSGAKLKDNVESFVKVEIYSEKVQLSVDGAVTGQLDGEFTPLYPLITLPCLRFYVGANDDRERLLGFRGGFRNFEILSSDSLLFHDIFTNLTNWDIIGSTTTLWDSFHRPITVLQRSPSREFYWVPPCGKTICDSPEVISSYSAKENYFYRKKKVIKYTLVVLSDDSGSNQVVNNAQIESQHMALNNAYGSYNITFDLNVIHIQKTELRRKTLIFGCSSSNVGDGICQKECRIPATGDDGGDCVSSGHDRCDRRNLRNGKCDLECNSRKHFFDGGDCCLDKGVGGECIDPESPYRQYMTPEEFKKAVGLTVTDSLIVYFGNWPADSLVGVSTFPWEPEAGSPLGGIVIQPHRFGLPGQNGHLIHEIGHVLGLWHVHHGVTELPCDHPCFEEFPSMETGDLCSDTGPTPRNMKCEAPSSEFSCGRFRSFTEKNTMKNFMGYAGNECANHFTDQQVARMHCYIDLKYSGWIAGKVLPTTVPISPRVVPKDKSIQIFWAHPLNPEACRPFQAADMASTCTSGHRFVQFAHNASSSGVYQLHGFWTPSQATGLPDAESCSPSVKSWLPDTPNCDESNSDKCVLRVWPEIQTVVEKIFIWFTWNAANGIRKITVIFGDDSEQNIEDVFAYCDRPTSFNIYETRKLKEIQIFINNPFVAIDAVKMISTPGDGQCQHCNPAKYRVRREPGFKDGEVVETTDNSFEDFDVDLDQDYSYFVTVVDENEVESEISPKGIYKRNQNYCGNGIVEDPEECDDGNLFNSDGCSSSCKVETSFECLGSPSHCSVEQRCSSAECQKDDSFTTITIPPVNFKFYLSPPAGVHDISDLKFCSINPKRKLVLTNEGCQQIMGVFDSCSTDFKEHRKKYSMTIKAEFPLLFATGLLINVGVLQGHEYLPIIDRNNYDVEMIEFEISGVFENGNIEYFNKIKVNCSQNSIVVNLLPFVVTTEKLKRIQGVIIKNIIGGNDILVHEINLQIDNKLDLWSMHECLKSVDYYDPEYGVCISKKSKLAVCPSKPIVDLPLISNHCIGSSECQLKCQEGFQPITQLPMLKCSSSGLWRNFVNLQDPNNFCKPVDCGIPDIPSAEVYCETGTFYQQNCTVECDSTSVFIGSKEAERTITCQQNSKWTNPSGFCLPICHVSDITSRNVSTSTINCKSEIDIKLENPEVLPVNSICRATCKENHKVSETDQVKTKVICGKHGTWIGPSCKPAKCPTPKMIYTGIYNCTDGFNVNSECYYSCPGQQVTKLSKCLPDGSWSIKYPCKLNQKLVCPVPESTKDVIFHCSKKLFVGQSCTAKCRSPGYDIVNEIQHQLPSGQILLQLTPVSTVSCTASSKLHPDPMNIKCVRVCNKKIQGDGWCDFQNNRGYCNWDNGDCCASTSRNGQVRYMFPSLCTNAFCRCLDPNASENYYSVHSNKSNQIDRKLRTKRILLDYPSKKHWVENLFSWLDSIVSEYTDLISLSDQLAILETNNSAKYSQISALNYEMRSMQDRKTVQSIKRTLAQAAQQTVKTELTYKSWVGD